VRSAKRLGVSVAFLHAACEEYDMIGTDFLRYLAIGSITLQDLEKDCAYR
jgi:hypothetical protein